MGVRRSATVRWLSSGPTPTPPQLKAPAGAQRPRAWRDVIRPGAHDAVRNHGIDLLQAGAHPGALRNRNLPLRREFMGLEVHKLEQPLHLNMAT